MSEKGDGWLKAKATLNPEPADKSSLNNAYLIVNLEPRTLNPQRGTGNTEPSWHFMPFFPDGSKRLVSITITTTTTTTKAVRDGSSELTLNLLTILP
jgi:hypothetical protein